MEPIITDCPVCGSGRFHPRYPARRAGNQPLSSGCGIPPIGHHPIVECLECGVAYARPRDPDGALPSLNRAVSLESYLEQEPGKSKMFHRQSARLERWLGRRGRLLDLGCAAGLFSRVAAERGWRVTGCDTWEEAVEYGRKRWQLDLRLAAAGDWGAVEGRFDAIVLWDSIEHLPRPGKILAELRGRLQPDGVLALSTPDYGSFSRRLLGSRWQFFERTHLAFFSRKTLAQTLEEKGYRVCECSSQPKIVSLGYLTRYLAKWHPGLSSRLGSLLEGTPAGRLLVTVPGGMMECYAQRG